MRAKIGVLLATAWLALFVGTALGFQSRRGEPRLTAQLTTGVAKLGAEVNLVVTVENAGFSSLAQIPAVEGLTIDPVGRPAVRSQTTFINGRVSRTDERRWVVRIRPLRTGEFEIPPLSVNVDGKTQMTPALPLIVVEDMKGADLGFLRISASAPKVVEGQPFSLELVFGWDLGLKNKIDYANLSLPWWGQLPGTLELESGPSRPGAREFEINLNSSDTIKVEEIEPQTENGRPFRTFRVLRSFIATRAVDLEFPSSFLEFGQVIQRRELFEVRREKVESYFVHASPFTVEVTSLPEEGRPLDYGGAIGSLEVRATAEPRDVDAGDSIKFSVEYSGAGNLEFFAAPQPARMPEFDGFRVYGQTESKEFDRRTIVYDIAPLSEAVTEIPALPLPVFDPEIGRYVSLTTTPMSINVRALDNAAALEDERVDEGIARDIRDIRSSAAGAGRSRRPGFGPVVGFLASMPLLWLALRMIARRGGDPNAPLERRRRAARRRLARELARASSAREQLLCLYAFLGARTRESSVAWEGRDPGEWLESEFNGRLPEGQVRSLEQLLGELERAVWAGTASGTPLPRQRVLDVADELIGAGL